MVNIDRLTDLGRAPQKLLEVYIEQLFAHIGDKITDEKIIPCGWVVDTRDSYALWLSYAMLGVPEDATDIWVWMESIRPTEDTPELQECLDKAPEVYIQRYYDWAFPRPKADKWRKYFGGRQMKFFVSPVHFWFFVACHLTAATPSRSPRPRTPNDLFRHPLFFVESYNGPFVLVVPEYFLNERAVFDGLQDPKSTAYYIFPYFARWLIKYTEIPIAQRTETFGTYYLSHERIWYLLAGSKDVTHLIEPHRVLRRHWRWREVLEIVWSLDSEKPEKGPRPRWWQKPPLEYRENEQIAAYLDSFGEMADAGATS